MRWAEQNPAAALSRVPIGQEEANVTFRRRGDLLAWDFVSLRTLPWRRDISYWTHGVDLLQHDISTFRRFMRTEGESLAGPKARLNESAFPIPEFIDELDMSLEAFFKQHDRARRVTCSKEPIFREYPEGGHDSEDGVVPENNYHLDFAGGLSYLAEANHVPGKAPYVPLRPTNQSRWVMCDFANVWFPLSEVVQNFHMSFLYRPHADAFVTVEDNSAASIDGLDARVMFVPEMRRYQALMFRSTNDVPDEAATPVHGSVGWPHLKRAPRISLETRCAIWKEQRDGKQHAAADDAPFGSLSELEL